MKTLATLLGVVSLLLSSCATEHRIPAALDTKIDSALTAAGVPPLRKAKFTGPVTFQIGGAGNVATTLTKARAPVASAPYAAAAETKAGPPWWVYAGIVVLGLASGFVLRGCLKLGLPF